MAEIVNRSTGFVLNETKTRWMEFARRNPPEPIQIADIITAHIRSIDIVNSPYLIIAGTDNYRKIQENQYGD